MAAGRAWALGGTPARTDGASEDARRMGIDLGCARLDGDEGLWPWHLPARRAFGLVATQWRVAGTMERVIRAGLDYVACRAAWEMAGTGVTPDLFEEVQAIEAGALEAMREARP